jgi:hypothetical protein
MSHGEHFLEHKAIRLRNLSAYTPLSLSPVQIADPHDRGWCIDIPLVNDISGIRHLLHHVAIRILIEYYINGSAFSGMGNH